MRGRKPKPTAMKLLEGNPGRRPLNVGEPRPIQRIPTCPAHLCSPAKAEWKRLAVQLSALRILTELDRAALAAYCQAYGRWVEAERKLRDTPMLLKMPSGYVQQNPWLTIANKQLELMQWLCRLITPPGGTVLDPFAGSGTTGAAARLEGFRAVLIEREAEYQQDIRNRFAASTDLLEAAE